MKKFSIACLLVFFVMIGFSLGANAQMPSPEPGYQKYLNPSSGCYERVFKGDEAERTVPASQIIAALDKSVCVIVSHAVIKGVLDFTPIDPTPPANMRRVVSPLQITDSELQGIKAGALGDVAQTLFADPVNFSGSQIKGDAEFVNVIFASAVNFQGTDFSGTAALNGAHFEKGTNFSKAKFEQLAFLFGTHFDQDVTFAEAQFASTVRLFNVEFKGSANFQDATFGSTIDLSNSLYASKAIFANAHFTHGVTAKNIEFAGPVRFDSVRVDDTIDFSATRFNNSVSFNRATLSGARFFGVRFAQGADFTSVHFTTDTSFNSAIFGALTFFNSADFDQAVIFSNSIFLADALFVNTKFMGDADFGSVRFSANLGPDFSGAQFAKTLSLENTISAGALRLTWDQVKGKLNPETPQVLGLLEKSFTELRQGQDAITVCEAGAKLQKEQEIALIRCTLLGSTLGIVPKMPEALKNLGEKEKKEGKAASQKLAKQKSTSGNLIPLVVAVGVLGLLVLFIANGGKL